MNHLASAFNHVATDNRAAAARFAYLAAAGWGIGDIRADLGIGRPALTALRAELRKALITDLRLDGYSDLEVAVTLGVPTGLAQTTTK